MTVLRRSFDNLSFCVLMGVLLSSCAEKTVQAPVQHSVGASGRRD